jgi:hypothetical protein
MKYIKPHAYKKSSLKSETTENERYHRLPRKQFVLWAIQILRMMMMQISGLHAGTLHSPRFLSIQETVLQPFPIQLLAA